MTRRKVIGIVSAGVILLGIAVGSSNNHQPAELNSTNNNDGTQSAQSKTQAAPKAKPICDGTTVTSNCTVDGITYSTYIYHAAVPEKTHTTTETTYQNKLVGYCTLCNDGTYSPSCATGSGACSWHHGVQEWNAPKYEKVPVTTTKTVVDAPAQAESYEKVPL